MRRTARSSRMARRSRPQAGTRRHAAGRPKRGRAPYPLRQSRCTRRSRRMSVEVTHLSTGLAVVTTAYYARVLRADVPLALDVLSDILADPSFDPEELRREQNVIVQEIGAAEDTPDDLIWDKLQETAFTGQPIGRSILGTPATVRSFDRARLAAYLSRNYRAPDMVIAAAGAVDHQAMVEEV